MLDEFLCHVCFNFHRRNKKGCWTYYNSVSVKQQIMIIWNQDMHNSLFGCKVQILEKFCTEKEGWQEN